jgi:GntR family transcriptional regulator, galactonate operon transcriptional repressor
MPEKDRDGEERSAGSRVSEVAAVLGRWIAQGRYPPASTLPTEPEIADALGVGRNAVREAVKMLAGKGLLRTGRRAGTIVQPHAEWNLLDSDLLSWSLESTETRGRLLDELMEMRRFIEPEAAALAAQQATTVQCLRMWEAFEAMERHRDDPLAAVDADILFHRRLFEAAGSRLLLSVFRSFSVLLRVNFATANEHGDAFAANLDEHKAVLEAVQRHDPDGARAAMLKLLARNRADVERVRMLMAAEAVEG